MSTTENVQQKICSFIKTDVTAVLLLPDFVFAGIGSWVHILNKESGKLLSKLEVWKGQKIYGFKLSKDEDEVLIFGGKQMAVISFNKNCDNELNIHVTTVYGPLTCNDWLHAAVWLDVDTFAVLTAHNVVQVWNKITTHPVKSYNSTNNSILYSGLLLPLHDEVLVMAGTVFSEVIVSFMRNDEPLIFLKGHEGVIFSICCDLQKQLIVTTSDDRSVRIWGSNTAVPYSPHTAQYWKLVTIVCRHVVYGHTARVMRSIIINDLIISIGEDSAICFWDLKGKLLKKNLSHQNGCIWALDADSKDLVTGGGDSAVIIHPLSSLDYHNTNELLQINTGNPKKIAFTARNNIVILNEDDELIYYDIELETITFNKKIQHESTYKLFSLSPCKQLIAIGDMAGSLDVFTETCKGEPILRNIVNTKLNVGKILSLHWAGNRHLVLCSEDGNISVLASQGSELEIVTRFKLPKCKERWLTSSAIDPSGRIFALGDRCGNIHIYNIGQISPVKTFNKVHGRYGPTSITIDNSRMTTTGRDGKIKHFTLNTSYMKFLYSTDLTFEWVEKFIDKNQKVICGFQERVFIVYDLKNNSRVVELACGGGHRAWDAVRYIEKVNDIYEEYIRIIYLKKSAIHLATIELSKVASRNMIPGSHTKEINCLKSHRNVLNSPITYFMSGGEDTTVRISSCKNVNKDVLYHDEYIFKHLSSVRSLKTCRLTDNKLLLITAGGRAQICIKILEFKGNEGDVKMETEDVIDYQVRGTDRERRANENWRNASVDYEPETRIMDVEIMNANDDEYVVAAVCSDAIIRLFKFAFTSSATTFKPLVEIKYHKTCILKTEAFNFNNKDILITTTTRGDVCFWDLKDIAKGCTDQPIFEMKTNKSGINSISVKVLSENDVVFATGGDDNAIYITLLTTTDFHKFTHETICIENFHCSEITGVQFVDKDMLLSTSIDQRVTLSRWKRDDNGLSCTFLSQTFTDVADVQGMDVIAENSENVTLCVFGKGLQVMNIPKVPS